MKSLNVPIHVDAKNGMPRRIRWGRRTYLVRKLLNYWVVQSRWWGREERRVCYRLETDGGVMEVYRVAFRSDRGARAATPERPLSPTSFPIEGDTHTREKRRTDAAYRPDVTAEKPRPRDDWTFRCWMLSKVLD